MTSVKISAALDSTKLSLKRPNPIDEESDSDFRASTYVYEHKKRKRKASRRSRGVDSKPRLDPSLAQNSPLAEFFGDIFGLHSIPLPFQSTHNSDADDESDDVQSLGKSGTGKISFTTAIAQDNSTLLKRGTVTVSESQSKNDSVTESDSEPEPPTTQTQRLASTQKLESPQHSRYQVTVVAQGSETESDTDEHLAKPTRSRRLSGSPVTETDSDVEGTQTALLEPKPSIAVRLEKISLPPLVLDQERGYMVPAPINTLLREYQRDGIRFFYDQFKSGLGALLGDDMGLGKTIQVISYLSAIMRKHGDSRDVGRRQKRVLEFQESEDWKKHSKLPPANEHSPTCLIVAPSSVVLNWERELSKWGYFDVGMYIGTPVERQNILKSFQMGRLDVVVTSFDTARGDIDLLYDLPWTVVIVDEVHYVKNPGSKLSRALNRLACHQRIGLTGTAIQNSYGELWTILNWANPGRVGTFDDWSSFVILPLSVGQSNTASEEKRTQARLVSLALRDKLLPRFFRRRTKDIIKDQLPSKIDQVVFCPLTKRQIDVYKRLLGLPAVYNMVHRDNLCTCGSKTRRKKCCYPWVKEDLFKYMSALIKISNHLALILPAPDDNPDQLLRNRELAEAILPEGSGFKYSQAMLQPELCGKWLVLEALLEEWQKDPSNKILIFTKSVKLLGMLDYHLSRKQHGFVRLDGATKMADRMPLIDKFHEDPNITVFLISTLAGGTGLNLTGANKVVIFGESSRDHVTDIEDPDAWINLDPNWNPAHDLQAMDRAYRLGQTRDVAVYRLLGAGSIEELVYARQLYKQQQMKIGYEASVQTRYFAGVQHVNGMQGELFGLKNIFTLHEDTLATKMAIENAHMSELDWALEYGTSQKYKKQTNWVYDAEAGNADVDLGGLAALLLDDDIPQAPKRKDNNIDDVLKKRGVKYSHRNDGVLSTNPMEEERAKKAVQERQRHRMPKSSSLVKDMAETPEWPPKRKHHKPLTDSKERLKARRTALGQLGFLCESGDIGQFADSFAKKTGEEQREILDRLDEHARKTGYS